MDQETSERLRKLQMADLGTARREYVSTCDDPNRQASFRREDIEVFRESNIPGTTARLLAQMNKPMLDEWTNLHKSVRDTDSLEELDDILQGQAHRAHLSFMMQGQGRRPGETAAQGTGHHANITQSSGRGGGVIGTRGRRITPSAAASRTLLYGAVSKPGKEKSLSGSRHTDPALDSNNSSDGGFFEKGGGRGRGRFESKGRGSGERRGRSRGYNAKPSPVRARRAESLSIVSTKLSSPEEFMASIRQAVQGSKSTSDRPTAAAPRSASVAVKKESQRPGFAYRPEISIPVSYPASTKALITKALVSTSVPSVEATKHAHDSSLAKGSASTGPKVSFPLSSLADAKARGTSRSKDSVAEDTQKEGPMAVRTGQSLAERGSSAPKNEARQGTMSLENTSQPPAKVTAQKSNPEGDSAGELGASGVLLDIGLTPEPSQTPLRELGTYISSPGMEDLKGLDFSAFRIDRTLQEPSSVYENTMKPRQNLDSSPRPQNDSPADTDGQISPPLDEVQRVATEFLQKLSGFQKAFDAKIQKALGPSGGWVAPKHSAQHQVVPTPTEKQSERTPSGETRSEIGELGRWLQTSAMPVFTPTIDAKFSKHRSPVRSTSTEDSYSTVEESPRTPKRSMLSENMPTIETLRVSDSPTRQTRSQLSPEQKREPPATGGSTGLHWKFPDLAPSVAKASNLADKKIEVQPLAQSVHAESYPLHTQYGHDKVIGPALFLIGGKATRVMSEVHKASLGTDASLSQHSRNTSLQKEHGAFGVKTLGPTLSVTKMQTTRSVSDIIMHDTFGPSPSLSQYTANAPLHDEEKGPAGVRTIGPAPPILDPAMYAPAKQPQESHSRLYQQASNPLPKAGNKPSSKVQVLGPAPFIMPFK